MSELQRRLDERHAAQREAARRAAAKRRQEEVDVARAYDAGHSLVQDFLQQTRRLGLEPQQMYRSAGWKVQASDLMPCWVVGWVEDLRRVDGRLSVDHVVIRGADWNGPLHPRLLHEDMTCVISTSGQRLLARGTKVERWRLTASTRPLYRQSGTAWTTTASPISAGIRITSDTSGPRDEWHPMSLSDLMVAYLERRVANR